MELDEFVRTFDINTMKSASQFLDTVCKVNIQPEDENDFKSLVYEIINKTNGKNEFRTGLDEVLKEIASEHSILFAMYKSVFSSKGIQLVDDVPDWKDYAINYYFNVIDKMYNRIIDEFKKIDRDVLPSNVVSHIRDST